MTELFLAKDRDLLEYSNNKLDANGDVVMLKQRIEESIVNHKPIIVINSNPVMECRNTIFADDYDIEEDELYLNSGNFELHIDLRETEVKHDEVCDEEYVFVHDDTETKLYFIDSNFPHHLVC